MFYDVDPGTEKKILFPPIKPPEKNIYLFLQVRERPLLSQLLITAIKFIRIPILVTLFKHHWGFLVAIFVIKVTLFLWPKIKQMGQYIQRWNHHTCKCSKNPMSIWPLRTWLNGEHGGDARLMFGLNDLSGLL